MLTRKGEVMKAEKECLECCRNKVSGLLDQYSASEDVRAMILEQTERILGPAGDKINMIIK